MNFDHDESESRAIATVEQLLQAERVPADWHRLAAGPAAAVLTTVLERTAAWLGDGQPQEPPAQGALQALRRLALHNPELALAAAWCRASCRLAAVVGLESRAGQPLVAALPWGAPAAERLAAEPRGDHLQLAGGLRAVPLAGLAATWLLPCRRAEADLLAAVAATESGLVAEAAEDGLGRVGHGRLACRELEVEPEQVRPLADEQLAGFYSELDLGLTAVALALLQLCLEQARQAASRESPAGSRLASQLVRHSLAEMVTESQTAEILARRAAWAHTAGDREAGQLLLCARIFAAEAVARCSDRAWQAAGATELSEANRLLDYQRLARLLGVAGHDLLQSQLLLARRILS